MYMVIAEPISEHYVHNIIFNLRQMLTPINLISEVILNKSATQAKSGEVEKQEDYTETINVIKNITNAYTISAKLAASIETGMETGVDIGGGTPFKASAKQKVNAKVGGEIGGAYQHSENQGQNQELHRRFHDRSVLLHGLPGETGTEPTHSGPARGPNI